MSVPTVAHEDIQVTASGGGLPTVVRTPRPGDSEEVVSPLETPPGPLDLQADESEHEKHSAWIVRKLVGVCVILSSIAIFLFFVVCKCRD